MHGPFVQRQILTNLKLPRAVFLCQPKFVFHEAANLDLYLLEDLVVLGILYVEEDLHFPKRHLCRPLPAAHLLLLPSR